MRVRPLVTVIVAASALTVTLPAAAQVTESERAAARQLFKDGDELQRAGKFVEALDRFERAQQVFSAPTNMLRIAECNAALGHLVRSAEAYRALVRTPLPAGSPPAFQAAVDQARAELAQVEPRVPRLIIHVDPADVPSPELQIDGQSVHAALLGEPFPLDPGTHKVLLAAAGFVTVEQSVLLKERETRSLPIALKPVAGVTYALQPAPTTPNPPPPSSPAPGATTTTELPPGTPPAPPLIEGGAAEAARNRSRPSLILGAHLGVELGTGLIPAPGGGSIAATAESGPGLAYGLEVGVRFARHWIIELMLEHAGLGAGTDPTRIDAAATGLTSNTTSAGVVLGFVANPDRVSFYGEAGLVERWYTLSWSDPTAQSAKYSIAEVLLGLGIWIPAGRRLRLLPEATVGLGSFNAPSVTGAADSGATGSDNPGHAFFMFGMAGLFDVKL